MHATHHDLMGALDPSAPSTIDALIAFHRARFGDARMEAEETGGGEAQGEPANEQPAPWEKSGEEFDAEKAKTFIANLKRERDAERDRAKAAEAKVKEHDDAKLSETEKLQRELGEQKSAAAVKARLVDRYEVAEEVGLPLSWARRLVGEDREALLADAKAMKADLDETSKGGTPRPDPSQGGGDGGGKTGTVASSREDYLERRRNRGKR